MNKTMLALVSVVGMLTALIATAQGTLYVSNLGQTPTGSAAIGSDSWIAQVIDTGTNSAGYNLGSIQLLMNAASGNPSGFSVSIYSRAGSGLPGNSLGSLSGADPTAGGVFTYIASDVTLSPRTSYYVVVTASTPVSQGTYSWSAVSLFPTYDDSRWVIQNAYYSSVDGSSWVGFIRQDVFQMAIYASAVPEPPTLALAGLGLAALSFWRFWQRK